MMKHGSSRKYMFAPTGNNWCLLYKHMSKVPISSFFAAANVILCVSFLDKYQMLNNVGRLVEALT